MREFCEKNKQYVKKKCKENNLEVIIRTNRGYSIYCIIDVEKIEKDEAKKQHRNRNRIVDCFVLGNANKEDKTYEFLVVTELTKEKVHSHNIIEKFEKSKYYIDHVFDFQDLNILPDTLKIYFVVLYHHGVKIANFIKYLMKQRIRYKNREIPLILKNKTTLDIEEIIF